MHAGGCSRLSRIPRGRATCRSGCSFCLSMGYPILPLEEHFQAKKSVKSKFRLTKSNRMKRRCSLARRRHHRLETLLSPAPESHQQATHNDRAQNVNFLAPSLIGLESEVRSPNSSEHGTQSVQSSRLFEKKLASPAIEFLRFSSLTIEHHNRTHHHSFSLLSLCPTREQAVL